MKRTINTTQGLVKEIISVTPHFKLVKLAPLSFGVSEEEIPFYGNLEGDYVGKFVTIASQRKGIFGKDFEQIIVGKNMRVSFELPYALVRKVNSLYGKLLDKK
jgi:hypothetical protein